MTEAEAIAEARRVAKENGWTFFGPGIARRSGWLSRLLRGGVHAWEVRAHDGIGCNVHVVINDATGEVIEQRFEPR
jgi:hypothetical protein